MQKIIEENMKLVEKIRDAVPSVSYQDHKEHTKHLKKLKKLVSFNSMRQSMITTVRNYFVRLFCEQ